jgi:hypothetical protein
MFISFADTPDRYQEIRLPNDVVYPDPQEGDRVEVDMLLSMVTAVRKLETPG